MKMLITFALIAQAPASAGQAAVHPAVAAYIRDCAAAGSRLWDRSLCAPIVVVDPGSGTHWSSEAVPGPLPSVRANTAFDWGGRKWIMVLTPLPREAAAVREIIFHEAWHAHQQELGLPSNAAVAPHLDTWRNRYLMRLEWNALRAALQSSGSQRRKHVRQALAFRQRRLASSPAAAEAERAAMRHEGLAAYTGAALSGAPVDRAVAAIDSGPGRPGLARSFAYVSGPAWGLLLDSLRPGWRGRLAGGSDLPDLAGLLPAARPRADDYGGTALLQAEQQAGIAREARIRAALAATSERSGLRIPLASMQMDFDPNDVSTGPDGSTIYHRITLRDRWGRIVISGTGLRVLPDFRTAYAPWPLREGGLELSAGWRVVNRAGGGSEIVPAE